MRQITIRGIPGYVHAVCLQDAVYKACRPKADERNVIAERSEVKVSKASDDVADGEVIVVVSGSYMRLLETILDRTVRYAIQCFRPKPYAQPTVHVRFDPHPTE